MMSIMPLLAQMGAVLYYAALRGLPLVDQRTRSDVLGEKDFDRARRFERDQRFKRENVRMWVALTEREQELLLRRVSKESLLTREDPFTATGDNISFWNIRLIEYLGPTRTKKVLGW